VIEPQRRSAAAERNHRLIVRTRGFLTYDHFFNGPFRCYGHIFVA
jgi:hypothetical protein